MRERIVGALLVASVLSFAPLTAALAGVDGFGDDVPMSLAVKQIVPDGMRITFGNGVDVNRTVSWNGGGGEWKTVLEGLARQNGLVTTYVGDEVRLTVQGAPSQVSAMPAPAGGKSAGITIEPYRGGGSAAPAAPEAGWEEYKAPAPAPMAAAWQAPAGESLRTILSDWATRGGWSLAWETGFEYRINNPIAFQGNFVDAAGALVRSLRDVRPAVSAEFYSVNKVLVVRSVGERG